MNQGQSVSVLDVAPNLVLVLQVKVSSEHRKNLVGETLQELETCTVVCMNVECGLKLSWLFESVRKQFDQHSEVLGEVWLQALAVLLVCERNNIAPVSVNHEVVIAAEKFNQHFCRLLLAALQQNLYSEIFV